MESDPLTDPDLCAALWAQKKVAWLIARIEGFISAGFEL